MQVCAADGTFDACACGGDGTGAAGSAGTGASSTGATGAGLSGPVGISSGGDKLVDVFVADAGVIVVLVRTVRLLDRGGKVLHDVLWPRDILTAAFDGEHLVVADTARFTTLDLALGEVASADLVEACVSAVLVGGKRFVCGPENDWDRVFYTYSATDGALLAQSLPYTYNGIPMRRIPGTDEFITVSVGTSPTDFFLYSVGPGGAAVFVNESPYHGDFPIGDVYAFDGVPPVHVVTHQGVMLRIHGDGCSANTYPSGCFVKDGALGTLSSDAWFLGMDSGGDGKLSGIVTAAYPYGDSLCEKGCLVQRVDVAANTVDTERSHTLDVGAVIAARHDPVSGAFVVGYRLSGSYYSNDDPYPGHRVDLLPYQ